LTSDAGDVAERLGPAAREFEGKTILLTGAAGFLGRHFRDVFAHLNSTPWLDPPAWFASTT
jgi:FlaA1/EpsC-like NDP-sugar epimerase